MLRLKLNWAYRGEKQREFYMERQGITQALGLIHPITLVKGQNAEVWDVQQKRYIDFVGGIGVLNFGHCHPKIVAAIQTQAQQLTHYAFNAAQHQPYLDYMEKLTQFIPMQGDLVGMLTNSGAEATENALKVARICTGRTGVIAFDGGFHGRTLAALNLNGKVTPYKNGLGALPGPVYHLPFPSKDNGISIEQAKHALQRLGEVEVSLSEIAAVIVEPIQGEGGFKFLQPEYAQYLREFCTQHGIVLIIDEIQSGFGRSGVPFAFSHLNIQPDLLLLGKSIAGGVPLGALIGDKRYMNQPIQGALGGTYSGNPIACAAALATLDLIHSTEVIESSEYYIQCLEQRYAQWQQDQLTPWLGKLTGMGAMRGIELQHQQDGRAGTQQLQQVLQYAREMGLLLMPSGKHKNIIRLLPPLTITPALLEEGLDILEKALAMTAESTKKEKSNELC